MNPMIEVLLNELKTNPAMAQQLLDEIIKYLKAHPEDVKAIVNFLVDAILKALGTSK